MNLPIIELLFPNAQIDFKSGILNCAKLHSEEKYLGIGKIFLKTDKLHC